MEPSNQEVSTGSKRKRTPGPDDGRQSVPPLAQHSAGGVNVTQTQVSYLMRAKAERLRLIEGDSDTFADILGMIDDYEGVLQRHESLAANLGAKLVGPLLLKSFEKLFDGPITVVNASFALEQSPVSWLDIVTFARTNPLEFILSENHPGSKTCRFWIKGGQVEISEDDYRLIMSGAPERMIPTQPLPEDEAAELATLNILETRLAMLIKKADAVASKARQLNYHLKGRKTAVLSRKAAEQPHNPDPETRTFSPQPFSAVNPRPNGENIKIQQRLLDQYRSLERRPPTSHSRSKPTRVVATETAAPFVAYNGQEEPDTRRLSHPPASSEDGSEGQYRVLMASKIEKLSRGDPIHPPCDRCRRLRFDCTKHLTACQACTKKHAKCSWKDIKEGELEYVPLLAGGGQIRQGSEGVYGGRGGSWEGSLNLDPGLQSAAGVAGGAQQQQHSHPMMIARDGRDRDRERGDSEQAMLTQIAAAAAGR
ncbi:hypothetical protein QTJ16_002168 [Diplocarpon rosae]|uniref:Zn(2)-C6 fungal-type domain-containing protein n=1 Tax=Diplocarpon rosae TaxID=946125 RepID=A0AAD9T490_9HELO|nr:hypothetical protein QTJ16_002168 [Diplocarpon rosae]PBP16652.1 hypothetical protein BUE80_DR012536 [Diplocarpon rosae]